MTPLPQLLEATYAATTAVVTSLDDDELQRPTRCSGWSIADLTFHLLLDAQRALVTFASTTDDPPDVDRATYWAPHKPGAAWAATHEEFIRRSVAAHESPGVVVRRWAETSAAAARAAATAPSDANVQTQGHVLTVPDFISTLVVEGVLHHLDLVLELPHARMPAPVVFTHAREVFDEILGAPAPADWSDVYYALAAGGRVVVPDDDAERLGDHANRFPLLG
jgi:uncharacterized protein (TIGR03083 family)